MAKAPLDDATKTVAQVRIGFRIWLSNWHSNWLSNWLSDWLSNWLGLATRLALGAVEASEEFRQFGPNLIWLPRNNRNRRPVRLVEARAEQSIIFHGLQFMLAQSFGLLGFAWLAWLCFALLAFAWLGFAWLGLLASISPVGSHSASRLVRERANPVEKIAKNNFRDSGNFCTERSGCALARPGGASVDSAPNNSSATHTHTHTLGASRAHAPTANLDARVRRVDRALVQFGSIRFSSVRFSLVFAFESVASNFGAIESSTWNW